MDKLILVISILVPIITLAYGIYKVSKGLNKMNDNYMETCKELNKIWFN